MDEVIEADERGMGVVSDRTAQLYAYHPANARLLAQAYAVAEYSSSPSAPAASAHPYPYTVASHPAQQQ